MSEGRKLARDGLIYIAATLAAKGTPFVLMIGYANILPAAEFGLVGTVMAAVSIASVYVGLRPDIYVFKHFHNVRGEISERIASLYLVLVVTFMVALGVLLLIAPLLSIPSGAALLFAVGVACLAGTRGAQLIPDSILMSAGLASRYAMSQIAIALSFVIITLPAAYYARSWEAVTFGNAAAWGVGAAVSTILSRSLGFRGGLTGALRQGVTHVRDTVKFLFPLTFHVIGFTSVTAIDRLLLLDMKGAESVGAYTAAYTLGLVLGVGHEALLKAWNPFFFRRINADNIHPRDMLKIQAGYSVASVISALVFGVLAGFAFDFLFPAEFAYAASIVPIICLAYGLEGARKVFCGQLYVYSRTKTLAAISLLAAVANIGLNLLWIPSMGIAGAAYATLASFALMTLAVVAFSVYLSLFAAFDQSLKTP